MNAPRISIVVMAAGQSRRMGGVDKLLLPFKGQSLLEDRVEVALKTGKDVYVVLPSRTDFPDRWSAVKSLRATLVECADSYAGLGESLACAFRQIPNHYDAALIFLADMPALTTDDLSEMTRAFQHDQPLRATGQDGAIGHPVVIPQRMFLKMAKLSGDVGAQKILQREKTLQIQLSDNHACIDIDTPGDWDSFANPKQNAP